MRGNVILAEIIHGHAGRGRSWRGPQVIWAVAAAVAILGLLVAACQGGMRGSAGDVRPVAALPPARVTVTTGNLSFISRPGILPGLGSVVTRASEPGTLIDRRPDLGIRVSVTGGSVTGVVAADAAGRAVPGRLGAGATTWQTDWALAPGRAYHVTVTAVNQQGRASVATGAFRTMAPQRTFSAWTSMGAGQVFGVGMPIMITFSHAITDRAEVERALEVWSSKPVIGAWYWMSDTEVWFRTRTYWPAHTQVRVEAHLKGVRGAPGVYGDANLSQSFRVGRSLIAVASAASHHMKVWWNGHLEGNWPISTGQPGDDTPNGHYLSFSMGNPVDMNSATYGVMPGDPGYYNVLVYDSVKFTNSGDYVHSAPWSVGEQGLVNVSHGCVNVAPANAAWYYGHSLLGDPITVVGSPLRGTWGDGWTIWFLSWHKLLAGSATRRAVVADSHGSQFVPARVTLPSSMHVRTVEP